MTMGIKKSTVRPVLPLHISKNLTVAAAAVLTCQQNSSCHWLGPRPLLLQKYSICQTRLVNFATCFIIACQHNNCISTECGLSLTIALCIPSKIFVIWNDFKSNHKISNQIKSNHMFCKSNHYFSNQITVRDSIVI